MIGGWGPRASARIIAGVLDGARAVRRPVARAREIGLAALVKGWLEEEGEARRFFLWLPVAFGSGLLLYFSATSEPSLWAPLVTFSLAVAAAIALRSRQGRAGFRMSVGAAAVMAGFATGAIKTALVMSPVIERTLVSKVTAYVETIDPRENGARLLLRPVEMQGVEASKMPARIRVTVRTHPAFEAGATIQGTMRLLPPPRPSEPGGYDFSRDAWFQKIGAVGSVSSVPALAADADVPLIARINATIDRARNRLTRRIIETVVGSHGPVAAALVTGKRGQISEESNEALRGAGIYHVVSISGLHMVLAAGLFL